MKKRQYALLLVAIVLLIAGCSINNKNKGTATEDWELDESRSELLEEANRIVREKRPMDLVKFLDNKMIRMRAEELTEIVYLLNDMQENYQDSYDEKLKDIKYQQMIANNIEEFEEVEKKKSNEIEESLDFVEDEDLKVLLEEIYSGNYKITSSNTGYKVRINYDKYRSYENNMLTEVKNYIDIQRKDQTFEEEPAASFGELGNKLMSIEKHLKAYNKGFGYENLLRMYSRDLRTMLEGSDRLSLLDDENKIKSNVIDTYKLIAEENTITSNAVKEYLEEIENSDGFMTDRVRDSVLVIHNKAIDLLEK